MFSALEDWNPYDIKASWVAVFLLLILWWLSLVPLVFFHSSSGKVEEGLTTTQPTDEREERWRRIACHFRDGLLFLLTATTLTVIAAGPPGATNTLAWIFTAFWILIGFAMIFVKWRRVMNALAFTNIILIIAIISNSFAHSAVRSQVIGS